MVFLWLGSSAIQVGSNHTIDDSCFNFKNSPNCIGAFSIYKANTSDGLPKLYLSIDSIKKENSKIGFLTTTAFNKVIVKKLQLKTFISSNTDNPIGLKETSKETTIVDSKSSCPEAADLNQIIMAFYDIFEDIRRKSKLKILLPEFDISDISEIAISDFSYVEDFNGKSKLQVTSSRAYSSYKTKGLSLRGNIIIRSADGTRLQCNNLIWDYDDMTFKVNGLAILNRDNNVLRFKDTVFNRELFPMGNHLINAKKIIRRNKDEG